MLLYQINPVGAQLFYVNTFSFNKFAIGRWIREYTSSICVSISNACINVDSEGEGGPRAYVGHLTFVAFPILGNLTDISGSQGGDVCSFAWRNGTKSYCPMCLSVR